MRKIIIKRWLIRLGYIWLLWLSCSIPFSPSAWGIPCLDEVCVGCHVIPTPAINVALTHPNLAVGCITCHSPECLPGLHKDGLRQLDPLYYSYTGTAANKGCNICHGAPPQALCIGGIVMDHCLDPSGCNPSIFSCLDCHLNFNGTPAHIYPKLPGVPLFASVATIDKCLYCHGLSLLVGRSGAHATHFITKLMAPPTTSSFGISIGCLVCHPNLTANLGADHLVCIPGTSNAWLPGKVPVIFDPLLPQIGVGDAYIPGLVGGTGSCIIYCHSNGQTPPTTLLTAALGYPGSFLPLPWNVPFPLDPITLDCGCCHTFPPVTHSASKSDCNQCHPTPVIGTVPTSVYHINGLPDLWKFLAAASPPVPLILSPALSPNAANDLLLASGLGLTQISNVQGIGTGMLKGTYDPQIALLAAFGMISGLANPYLSMPYTNNVITYSLTDALGSPATTPVRTYTPSILSAYQFGIPSLLDGFAPQLNNTINSLSYSPLAFTASLPFGGFTGPYLNSFQRNFLPPYQIQNLWNSPLPFPAPVPNFWNPLPLTGFPGPIPLRRWPLFF